MSYLNQIEHTLRFKSLKDAQDFFKYQNFYEEELAFCPLTDNIGNKGDILSGKDLNIYIDDSIGDFGKEAKLWSSILKRYVDGWIIFYGESQPDIWKLKFEDGEVKYFTGFIEFIEADLKDLH